MEQKKRENINKKVIKSKILFKITKMESLLIGNERNRCHIAGL